MVGEIVALEEEAGEGGEAGKGRKSGGAVGKDKKTRFVAKVTYRIEAWWERTASAHQCRIRQHFY